MLLRFETTATQRLLGSKIEAKFGISVKLREGWANFWVIFWKRTTQPLILAYILLAGTAWRTGRLGDCPGKSTAAIHKALVDYVGRTKTAEQSNSVRQSEMNQLRVDLSDVHVRRLSEKLCAEDGVDKSPQGVAAGRRASGAVSFTCSLGISQQH